MNAKNPWCFPLHSQNPENQCFAIPAEDQKDLSREADQPKGET